LGIIALMAHTTPSAPASPARLDIDAGFDFDHAVVAPFRMQPGLRRLAESEAQLTPAGAGSRHQREKLAVLGAFADEALQCAEGFDPAPALHTLSAQAAAEHPQHFAWDGRSAVSLGLRVACDGALQRLQAGSFGLGDEAERCLQALAPHWRLAGLLSLAFEEDFAIVDGDAGTLPWMAVALPSHWAPRDKVGRAFTEAHAPVADNGLLMRAAMPLMQLVTAPERWERFVWNITGHPRLHAHPAHVPPLRWPQGFDPAAAWWRTERQTFIPCTVPDPDRDRDPDPDPGHGRRQAVFTIRVQVQPLALALAAPGRAAKLHAAVASMSPAVLAYRSLFDIRAPLLNWLAAQG